MATISKLVVALQANSAQLVTELNKVSKKTQSWANRTRSQFNTVAKAAATAAAAMSAAFIGAVNKQAGAIDQLAKEAAKLGIDTSQLERLRYQAELTGVSSQKLGMGMQRMTRRISEAAAGTGEAQKALKELGIDARRLNQLDAEEQFNAIAEAMKKVGNQADKVRLTSKIFDSEGVALVNTFNSNLKETADEFDALGLSITSSQAALVESFNDSKTKLGKIFDGFLNQVTIQVAPAFQMVTEWLKTSVTEFGGMGKVATKVTYWIAKAVGSVANMMQVWQILIKGVQYSFARLAQGAITSLQWIYDQYADIREFIEDDFVRADSFQGLADAFGDQAIEIEKRIAELTNPANLPSLKIDSEYSKIQEQVRKAANDGTKKQTDVQRKNSAALHTNTAALEKLKELLDPEKKEETKKAAHLGFERYAAALKREVLAGGNRQQEFARKAQHVLDGLAGKGENGLNFGGADLFDIEGMQKTLNELQKHMNNDTKEEKGTSLVDVIRDVRDGIKSFTDGKESLAQQIADGMKSAKEATDSNKPRDLGTVKLSFNMNGTEIMTEVMADSKAVRKLNQLIDRNTQSSARAAVR